MLPTYSHKTRQKPVNSVLLNHFEQEMLISLQNIHYTYLSGSPLAQNALAGANMTVDSGRIHAIAGTNGSGKSTLLQCINGILRPDQGSVHVGSLMVEDPKTPLREVVRHVGLVFQSPEAQFFEEFVGDEIAYGPKQFGMDNLRERVRQAMEWVGLDFDALKDRRLETLSGGEKRKVALASTLVLDQEILLFDEPSAGMDPLAREELLILFKRLSNMGKTILIASHRMEELASIAQDLSLLRGGEVVRSDSCKKVMADTSAITQVGLLPPLAIDIAYALIKKGWPIDPQQTITPDQLFSAIKGVIT
jgi:energy-coupling factor transport system ATP-binding protein